MKRRSTKAKCSACERRKRLLRIAARNLIRKVKK